MNFSNMSKYDARRLVLIRFLKEQQCFREFIVNCYKYCYRGKIENKKQVKNTFDNIVEWSVASKFSKLFFSYSFNWSLTPEGNKFWSNINDKWKEYLRENHSCHWD